MQKQNSQQLKKTALESRKIILKMLTEAGNGHPGGSLSAIDIITALYFNEIKHDPKNPKWEGRDYFILGKGHGVPALYATLAQAGYFDVAECMTLRKLGSRMQGHPDRTKLNSLEASTGSLGQGLSIAQGYAMASRLDKKDNRVYCLIGDGESQEGQIWEAAMSITKYKLSNMCVILDENRFQIDGSTQDVMSLEPVMDKWKAFGFNTLEIDGHNMDEILNAFKLAREEKSRPTFIRAHTIKGKGVSFMENNNHWHGVSPTKEELVKALKELDEVKI
ncbi:MAG: transketolase [Oligoflexia bacterium]|nr:transketolase [Oligoflexia bacterium]